MIWNVVYAEITPWWSRCRNPRVEIPFGSVLVTVWNRRILHVGVVFPVLLLLVVLPTFQFPRFLTHFQLSEVAQIWHACSPHQYPGGISWIFEFPNIFRKTWFFRNLFGLRKFSAHTVHVHQLPIIRLRWNLACMFSTLIPTGGFIGFSNFEIFSEKLDFFEICLDFGKIFRS